MQNYEDRERAVLVAIERIEGQELLDESNGRVDEIPHGGTRFRPLALIQGTHHAIERASVRDKPHRRRTRPLGALGYELGGESDAAASRGCCRSKRRVEALRG